MVSPEGARENLAPSTYSAVLDAEGGFQSGLEDLGEVESGLFGEDVQPDRHGDALFH